MRIQFSVWLITCLSICIGFNQSNGLAATGVDRLDIKTSVNSREIAIATGQKSNCYPSQISDRHLISDRRISNHKKRQINKLVKASEYYSAGEEKYEEKDYQGALKDLNTAIALNPQHTCAYNTRGLVKEKLNDISGAIADYDRSILMGDEHVEYAYANRGRLKAEKLNDFHGALTDYNKSISIAPLAYNYIKRGDLKVNRINDINGALQDYTLAIEFDPEYYYAYLKRAEFKADRLSDLSGAIADYDRAIEIAPESALAYTSRGYFKISHLNDAVGAVKDLDLAIELDPQDSYAHCLRGSIKYQRLDNSTAALADLDRAIVLAPNYIDAYFIRGEIAYTLDNKILALKDFNAVSRSNVNIGKGEIAKGIIDLERGQNLSAIAHFDRAITFNADIIVPGVYKYRGIAYRRQGKIVEARQDWLKAVEIYQSINFRKDEQIVEKWLQQLDSK
jgi:tetratricopeptide (TPR) repeat protein